MSVDELAALEVILHLAEDHAANIRAEINNAHDRQTHIRVSRLAYEAEHLNEAIAVLRPE